MRIPLTCMQCFRERGQPDDFVYPAELQDNGLYRMKCRSGHDTVTCVQEQKFEVLFELALNAIVDGYYREAVASFTSALERFYEFYIQVLCVKRGLPEVTFSDAWKKVARQSERQFGAYLFAHVLETASAPPLLTEALITFRNDVIHKGKIPSRDEALRFGQAVLEVVTPILGVLKRDEAIHVGAVVNQHIRRTMQQIEGTPHVSFMSISTTVSIVNAETGKQNTVADSVAHIAARRALAGW